MPGVRRLTEHDFWPRPGTRLLLQAALQDGEAAVAAFDAWIATGPPARPRQLDAPDRRLLPLVAARLRRLGVERPYFAVCDEVARDARARGRELLRGAAGAITLLGDAGIEVLALKGVPLLLTLYRDPALRPMADVDLMVRPADLPRALRALRAAGWEVRDVPRGYLDWVWSVECRRGRVTVDLHQYLIEYGSSPEVERGLWQRARALDVLGARCRAPAPTDLLLHVCLAGLKYGRVRNSRWITDSVTLLRDPETVIDWPLLVAEVARRRVALPMRECVQYLADLVPESVPAEAVRELWRLDVHASEARIYRALTTRAPSLPQLLDEYVGLYQSAARAAGARLGPLGFLRFTALTLAYRWNLPGVAALPRAVASHLVRREGGRVDWQAAGQGRPRRRPR